MRLCMCPPHTTVIYLQSIHAHGVANNIFMSDFHVCVFAMHQITKNAYKMNVKKNHLFVCLFVVFYFHLQFLLLLLLFQRVSPIFICESVLCSHTHTHTHSISPMILVLLSRIAFDCIKSGADNSKPGDCSVCFWAAPTQYVCTYSVQMTSMAIQCHSVPGTERLVEYYRQTILH